MKPGQPYPRRFKAVKYEPKQTIPGGWVDLLTDPKGAAFACGSWTNREPDKVVRWKTFQKTPTEPRQFDFNVWALFPDDEPEFNQYGEVSP